MLLVNGIIAFQILHKNYLCISTNLFFSVTDGLLIKNQLRRGQKM